MAASRIAGITVEIGGDTTKLSKALSGVNKEIKETQTALKDVDKLLKIDPGNTELLRQKQNDLKNAIQETKDKLQSLQDAAKNSDLGASEHDALQREIIDTQQQLRSLESQYRDFGGKLTAGVTMPLVGLGTAGDASFAEVDKTMGSTKEEADALNTAMKDAAANSVYGINDAATASLNFACAGLVATINGFHGALGLSVKRGTMRMCLRRPATTPPWMWTAYPTPCPWLRLSFLPRDTASTMRPSIWASWPTTASRRTRPPTP